MSSSLRTSAVLVLLCVALASNATAGEPDKFVRRVPGSLVLAGHGEISDDLMDLFLELAGRPGARVLVVSTEPPKTMKRWRERGALSVGHYAGKGRDARRLAQSVLAANAVWFEDGAMHIRDRAFLTSLLRGLLERGGVVGGAGRGAMVLPAQGWERGKQVTASGLGLLPSSVVELVDGAAVRASGSPTRIVKGGDGLVGFQIPDRTAMIVHRGRRVAVHGVDSIVSRIPSHDGWPERRRMVPQMSEGRSVTRLPHELDLMSWIRSSRDRAGPVFPERKLPKPEVPSGTLVLSGGGKVGDDILKAFIDAAGGPSSTFVCITSGSRFDPGDRIRSYSAKRLEAAGCKNVFVLHTNDPRQADGDGRWLRPLETAHGVWVDGGRTYRVMDALEGTRAQALMQSVLDRGGSVGGSSAGCQVAGAYLLRGDPRSNKTLVFDGYTRGLGFLPGVVLDAHFRQRERTDPLCALIQDTPQLLGIGVDADTAVMIRKHVAQVIGTEKVTFFAAKSGSVETTLLENGESFDLVKRRKIR